jgi:hypothetical protein
MTLGGHRRQLFGRRQDDPSRKPRRDLGHLHFLIQSGLAVSSDQTVYLNEAFPAFALERGHDLGDGASLGLEFDDVADIRP